MGIAGRLAIFVPHIGRDEREARSRGQAQEPLHEEAVGLFRGNHSIVRLLCKECLRRSALPAIRESIDYMPGRRDGIHVHPQFTLPLDFLTSLQKTVAKKS